MTAIGMHGAGITPIVEMVNGAVGVAGGWWDDFGTITCCIAAYQPVGAASLAASYTDLSGNGNDCAPGVPPGWNAVQGWLFTGVEWLDTGIIPVNDQTWSMLVQYTNAVISGAPIAGCSTGIAGFMLRPNRPGNVVGYRSGGNINVAPALVTGNVGLSANQGYRNGLADGGPIPPAAGAIADSIYVAAEHVGCVPAFIWGGGQIRALAIYNCTLSAGEMAAVATNMAAL